MKASQWPLWTIPIGKGLQGGETRASQLLSTTSGSSLLQRPDHLVQLCSMHHSFEMRFGAKGAVVKCISK